MQSAEAENLSHSVTPPPSSSNASSSQVRLGFLLACGSTFLYGISNIILRALCEYPEVPNDWILFYKELFGLVIILPWVAYRLVEGRYARQSWRLIVYLIFAAILCQGVGARLQLWSLGVLGLVLALPLIQATGLITTAMSCVLLTHEKFSRRRWQAIALLVIALCVLTCGKQLTLDSSSTIATSSTSSIWWVFAGVGATILTGISYAVYMLCVRLAASAYWHEEESFWENLRWNAWRTRRLREGKQSSPGAYEPLPPFLVVLVVLWVGVVIFGTNLYFQHGWQSFFAAPPICWKLVLASGCFNFCGFLLQIFALRLASATQFAIVSILQIILLTLAGYLLFHEAINVIILTGIVMVFVGVMMSIEPQAKKPARR